MTITHDEGRGFRAETEAGTARADYVREGDTVTFTHTEVPGAMQGQGVASALVGKALAWAKGEGLTVVPACAFVQQYVAEHPDAL